MNVAAIRSASASWVSRRRHLPWLLMAIMLIGVPSQAQVKSGGLEWANDPPALEKGAKLAMLSGDPRQKGVFTFRLWLPPNYAIAPHRHPSDEHITVIDGSIALGMGTIVDRSGAAVLERSDYAVAGANMNHYLFTDQGAIIQITAEGPFNITYANSGDDPRLR